jgi:hypothetical protein
VLRLIEEAFAARVIRAGKRCGATTLALEARLG